MTFKVGDRIRVKGLGQIKGKVTQINGDDKPYTIYVVLDKKLKVAGYHAMKEGWVKPEQIELIEDDDENWEDIWGNGAI